jgi:hypothetical protein
MNFLFEAWIAHAFVVIFVYTSRLLNVDALPVGAALITFAIVNVLALSNSSKNTICLAKGAQCNNSIQLTVLGKAVLALEESLAVEDQFRGTVSLDLGCS